MHDREREGHNAPGQYQPGSQSGQELLAHELAHVVQQSQGRVRATTQAKGVDINDDGSLEQEADRMAEKAARGQQVADGGGVVAASSHGRAPVQRYSKIGGSKYTMNGGAGDTMFESQKLDRSGGHHRFTRTSKAQRADGRLDVQDQQYNTGTGNWDDLGAVQQENLPPLNISRNGLLAIERDVSEARGFYIEAGALTQANDELRDNTNGVIRLFPTGSSIHIPAMSIHPWAAHDLQYVTVTTADAGHDAAADAPDLTRITQSACDMFTAHVTGSDDVIGAGVAANRNAAPTIGQNYHIHETAALYNDHNNNMRNYSAQKPGVGADDFRKMLGQLDELEAALEKKGIGATEKWFYSNNVRALLDTWGDHYEGVVAVDGPDRVTAVNFNRNTEVRWERRRVFGEYYRTVKAFRTEVRHRIGAPHQITWQQYKDMADQAVINLLNALGGAHANVATELTDLQTTVTNEAVSMWYFSMYGPAGQSFHAKFAPSFWTPETKVS